MRLGELVNGLPIDIARGGPDAADTVRIGDITEDSRTAVPGSLFVARRGRSADGRAFVRQAAESGAAAILTDRDTDPDTLPGRLPVVVCDDVPLMTALLAERLYDHPGRRLLLVGVTGTNGKSTVTSIVHQLLNRAGLRCGMISTVDVDDGAETAPAVMTTPPAIEMSRTLATMVETGCKAAAVEVSSHALDQKRADGLSFDAAVFTNVTGDHLDYHESFEAYVAAKRRLLALLDSASGEAEESGDPGGIAVLNADDPTVRTFEARRPVWCSASPQDDDWAGWTVRRTGSTLDGERLEITGPPPTDGSTRPRINARVALFGPHNAMNTLQAIAVSWNMLGRAGIEPVRRRRLLTDALTLVHPPRGRLEPIHKADDDIAVFVDFAHTDDALVRALEAVRQAMPRDASLWVVFGCGGERDRTKRPRMGRAAAAGADRVIVTSDNPRTESPGAIVDEVLAGIPADRRDRVEVQIDRAAAIERAIASARRGDVVLIAGKGHETEQILPDGRGGRIARRFVDQEAARAALGFRRARTGLVV